MKVFLFTITLVSLTACMKSKEDYREAISDIQEQQDIQREEEAPARNDQRSRGSNDAEGMGMDE